jgi:ATP-dependent RNA helicase RhlE
MSFKNLSLVTPILRALEEEGYENPTPIQQQAIPHVLKGRDLLGCAQTGTGKTAAFAIPVIQLQHGQKNTGNAIRTLILTPTRELAIQIEESFAAYGKYTQLTHAVVFGGVSQHGQVKALNRGVDVLVATPGRLLDLMGQGFVDLRKLEIFILDEADRMLDMGFINDVKRVIAKLPQKRQTLFFSATMPPEIQGLADMLLTDPVKVEVTPPATTVEKIEQSLYFTNKKEKPELLLHLLEELNISNALVFTRTKHGANKVVKHLDRARIKSAAIHGNKSQAARQAALGDFKSGKLRVLVATDIAARGIDIDELSHVFNFDLPNVPETYVHRIGRTGRAGLEGAAIAFCDPEQRKELKDIEKLIKYRIPVVNEHPYPVNNNPVEKEPEQAPRSYSNQNSRKPANAGSGRRRW